MTYSPDVMTHLTGQWAGLHCTRCQASCTEAVPCHCCEPIVLPVSQFAEGGVIESGSGEHGDSVPAVLRSAEQIIYPEQAERMGLNVEAHTLRDAEPEVEASAEPQAEVVFITDDDAGTAGESIG